MKKIVNIFSLWIVLLAVYYFYSLNPYYKSFFWHEIFLWIQYYNIVLLQIDYLLLFKILLFLYFIVMGIYYIFSDWKYSKLTITFIVLKRFLLWYKNILNMCVDSNEKQAILNVLVKLFFLPLMTFWFFTNLSHVLSTVNNILYYFESWFENYVMFYHRHLHWLILNIILFFDVTIFLIWYSIESERLWNKIKTVEPTLLWWLVTLACYPIFNIVTWDILRWYSSDYPNFVNYYSDIAVSYYWSMALGIVYLILMWIYVRASFWLWLKASNLTNRWIVSSGPYKYVRHPAYIAKNSARIVWAIPLIFDNFIKLNIISVFIITISLFWRITIYHLRALTEERHLWSDKDYLGYKKKVKYMYIPFIK